MFPDLLPWMLVAVAFGGAVFGALRARGAGARADALATELAERDRAQRAAERQASRRSREKRRRGEEMGDVRRKLDKVRKRAAEARDERDIERKRADELDERLAGRETELRDARAEAAAAAEALATSRAAKTPTRPATEPAPVRASEHDERVRRAEAAEARVHELETDLGGAHREVARFRDRLRMQDRLYTSMRLELAAKKERLRTQQEELERLRALRVAYGASAPGTSSAEGDGDADPPVSPTPS